MAYTNHHVSAQEHAVHKIILVVEDDDDIGTFLVEMLAQETPYKTMLVTDAFQALRAVNDIKPNLFITDYRLPNMDGIELYDRLRAKKELKDVPIILMSACLPVQEVQKRKLVGMSKPFELDNLLDTVERLLA